MVAYPINWWLVSHGLKHGMTTVRTQSEPVPYAGSHVKETRVARRKVVGMTAISFVVLAVGIGIAGIASNLILR